VEQDEILPMTVVERFHASKFRNKDVLNPDKKAVLKVIGGGGNKRQKTPVKDYVKGALRSLVETKEGDAMTHKGEEEIMEKQEMGWLVEQACQADPKHLTDLMVSLVRRNEYIELEL
jgi:hypothetical protein